MPERTVAPYGSWRSPISSDVIVRGTVGLSEVAIDGKDVYWMESRPGEGGRNVVVLGTQDGRTEDVTPQPFNARTRVHEYGGGDFVVHDSTIYFSNFADQRIYGRFPGEEPRPLTPETGRRYADMVVDQDRRRLIAVREDHTGPGREPVNEIVGVDLESGGEVMLASGNDFYSSPRLSPDGRRLAWLTWNHPNMPWDGTWLMVCDLGDDGLPENVERVAGDQDESIFQPEWSPEGTLHFVSDRTGWWNLYRLRGGRVEPLCEKEAEFGLPQWAFGMSTYDFVSPGRIVCSYRQRGTSHLATLDTETGALEPVETPYSSIAYVRAADAHGEAAASVFFLGGSPTETACVVRLDVSTGHYEVLRRAGGLEIDPGYLSVPEPVEFPTRNGQTAHAFFYAPKNRDYTAPEGELPPLLTMSHGGPTGATSTALDPGIQYWTSRGIAVLDVNYGGSTGYGREYRRRLDGAWGVVDVEDCAGGAVYVAGRGLVDAGRLMITGGSAGGYTTLCALAFTDTFAAGASHFGVSDVEALARETHKFESRYLERLIGPYPERADLYRERSPIHSTERLSCPVIFFQGLEDEVVPKEQAETMFAALRDRDLPVAYVPFEGEQHGFRRAENIRRALDGELYFYSRIFGFDLADPVEPVRIENLQGGR
ncbi:MAG: Prolyl oligopeptidase family protein [uncultured Rubrobacteraceae bacterium]|uniref:Prolyl oligopeptidase family protein n=1 Tax=uncultured Rubrobacteraceae bacterium TaxID=349277 RepID=A0A6J4R5C7_9ACTN|nr:MAG: Prolyl oligopeptidase family protein [uncultured Rubrobacteraceae bacterium]